MDVLNLPQYPFKVKQKDGKKYIFDVFRKTFVVITPEEWVRQHFLMWLVNDLHYPGGLIAVETPLKYNNLKKRADALIYNKQGSPVMLVECKAPHIVVNQKTFEQAAGYMYSCKTDYMALTNGMKHYCCYIDKVSGNISFLRHMPCFDEIS